MKVRKEQIAALGDGETEEELPLPSIPYVSSSIHRSPRNLIFLTVEM